MLLRSFIVLHIRMPPSPGIHQAALELAAFGGLRHSLVSWRSLFDALCSQCIAGCASLLAVLFGGQAGRNRTRAHTPTRRPWQ